MAATEGQATLMALYIGGISGGLISAILLNIPGTPASMATCLDGTPLARKGQAGKALGVGIVFSFMGTILSLLALVGISPALANIAIKFGPWEYFSITVFSLTLIITLSEENLVKGLITGIIGLMLATVGLAPIDSVSRYTFGSNALNGGFDILTVLVGVFAISEILLAAENSHKPSSSQKATVITDFNIKGFGFSLKEFFSQIPNCIRSALIGIRLGILPVSAPARPTCCPIPSPRTSPSTPRSSAPASSTAWWPLKRPTTPPWAAPSSPLLTLGIPGDSTSALLLGALIMKGVQPGPLIFREHGEVVYAIYAAVALSSLFMLFIMFFGMKGFVKILKVPQPLLLPLVFVLCMVGAYGTTTASSTAGP